jgi:hypothetical protein
MKDKKILLQESPPPVPLKVKELPEPIMNDGKIFLNSE